MTIDPGTMQSFLTMAGNPPNEWRTALYEEVARYIRWTFGADSPESILADLLLATANVAFASDMLVSSRAHASSWLFDRVTAS